MMIKIEMSVLMTKIIVSNTHLQKINEVSYKERERERGCLSERETERQLHVFVCE